MTASFIQLGIRVRDIAASARYFETVLGDSAATLDIASDDPGQQIKIVGSKNEVFFDLYAESSESNEADPPPGLIQYCLAVDDVDAAYRSALAAGAKSLAEPSDVEMKIGGQITATVKTRVAHVSDPTGTTCEFVDRSWIDNLW
jgi:predicted enzyme related to lactoylglutathione lyase